VDKGLPGTTRKTQGQEVRCPLIFLSLLSLFNTAGYIFGPLIVLAGVVALVLCLRASRRTGTPRLRQTALFGSLTPLATGVLGAIVGLILLLGSGQQDGIQSEQLVNLGKVCLAGLVITISPLLWSLMLFRRSRTSI